MSKNNSELCTLLVREMYGDLSSKVVDALLRYGRTSLQPLVRKVRLPERIVKQTLVVLIQQHLVLHHPHYDNGKEAVYYECNTKQIYELLHSGRIVHAVRERFGEDGASVVSNFLLLGHARVGDFISAYGITSKSKQVNGNAISVAATGTSQINTVSKLKGLIAELLKQKYLTQVHDYHMQPKTDYINSLRSKFRRELHSTATTEIALKKAVDTRITEYLEELENEDSQTRLGMKRKLNGSDSRSRKRQRLAYIDDDEEDDGWEIDDEIVLRINYERFHVLFRNSELVSLAGKRIGRTTSLIYAELLSHLEKKVFRCKSINPDQGNKKRIVVTTLEVTKSLNPDLNLENAIATFAPQKNDKPKKKRGMLNGVNHFNEDSEDDQEVNGDADSQDDYWEEDAASQNRTRLNQVKEHLLLLGKDSLGFVNEVGSRGCGEWSVDFERLAESLRVLELEKIIEDRFHPVATRIIRILRSKGKLDEKQVASIALLKQVDIRQHLSCLHERGHIEIQEVPKSNERVPSRTLFLFFFDDTRARGRAMQELYKGMSRILERIIHERSKHQILLTKAERTDVQGHESEYLTKAEQAEMAKWKAHEEALLGQVMRIDRQVMIFRDW